MKRQLKIEYAVDENNQQSPPKRTQKVDLKKVKVEKKEVDFQLKFDGRQCLLEQAIHVPGKIRNTLANSFAKIMLTSKQFYWTTRTRRVYRFGIIVRKTLCSFGFMNKTQYIAHNFSWDLPKAFKMISFLDPDHIFLTTDLTGSDYSIFLQLARIARGKVSLNLLRNFSASSQLIEYHWQNLSLLNCVAVNFRNSFPPRKFDYLIVKSIELMSEVRNILRNDATQLHLEFSHGFHNSANLVVQDAGKFDTCVMKTCTHSFLHAIRTMTTSCPTIKELFASSSCRHALIHLFTVDNLIADIVRNYKIFWRAVRVLRGTDIKSKISMHIEYTHGNFILPQGWMNGLLERDDFSQITHETTDEEGQIMTTFKSHHKDDKLNASFKIKMEYRYQELIVIADDLNFEDVFWF